MRRFRSPAVDIMRAWVEEHCGGQDPTEPMRALLDAIQVEIGTNLLRDLPRTRAYHSVSGTLGEDELLRAGNVVKLIRDQTGLAPEPGQPIERPARRGLSGRLQQ
jgi:hypothetical protein